MLIQIFSFLMDNGIGPYNGELINSMSIHVSAAQIHENEKKLIIMDGWTFQGRN